MSRSQDSSGALACSGCSSSQRRSWASASAAGTLALGPSVSRIHRSEQLTARHDIIENVLKEPGIEELPGWELEAVDGTDHLEGITIVRPATGERRHLAVSGLVVKISYEPAT